MQRYSTENGVSAQDGSKRFRPGDRMLAVLGMDDLTHAERCVMAALAYHDGSGGCYPSITTLAYYLNTKHWNISAHLDRLEKKGRIRRHKTQRVNKYILFYDSPCSQEIPESKSIPALKESPRSALKESLTLTGRTEKREKQEERESVYQEEGYEVKHVPGIGDVLMDK